MLHGNDGCDSAARRPFRSDRDPLRLDRFHEVVEQLVRHSFVEDAFVAESLEVELERFQFDADRVGRVLVDDRAEVRLPRLRTDARELRADNLDLILASDPRIREGFQFHVYNL